MAFSPLTMGKTMDNGKDYGRCERTLTQERLMTIGKTIDNGKDYGQ